MESTALKKFLQSQQLSALLGRELITVPKDFTLRETLTLFKKHDIISAPVQETKRTQEKKQPISAAGNAQSPVESVKHFGTHAKPVSAEAQPSKNPFIATVTLHDIANKIAFEPTFAKYDNIPWELLKIKEDEFLGSIKADAFLKPVSSVLNQSFESSNPPPLFSESDSVFDTLMPLASGFHSVVVRRKNEAFGLVSQWDIIKFLQANRQEKLGSFFQMPVSKIQGVLKPVVSVHPSVSVIQAFRVLKEKNVIALPIVTSDQGILGTLSASDLRSLDESNFGNLILPVLPYLKRIHGKVPQPIIVSLTDHIGQVINILIENKVHRAWLYDRDDVSEQQHLPKLIGVVTLTNIIQAMLDHCNWPDLPEVTDKFKVVGK